MEKGKILFVSPAHPLLMELLEGAGFRCECAFEDSKEEIEKRLEDCVGVVVRSRFPIDRTFLEAGKNLRFVAREGVGIEHIDQEAARRLGIEVLTSPEGSRDTVAEHTLGLLLALMNHLPRADRQVREGQWLREANRGVEIKGKTVGILGYGNMGQAFAQRLQGFACRVIAYDKYKSAYGDAFAEEVPLETLFEEADILSIHIFYEPANHYFVNDAFLRRFRKPIYLVNTARGLVLNTADLVKHLEAGTVRGAALDVL
ncbi:MAG: hydroxyacid dehydrogenase, partial [Bacteroidetes bacterium]